MAMFDGVFDRERYVSNGRVDHWAIGALLRSLSLVQHLYDKHDIAAIYRFLADMFDSEDFAWPGRNNLTNVKKSAKIQANETKRDESPFGGQTQPVEAKQNAKAVSKKEASKQKE